MARKHSAATQLLAYNRLQLYALDHVRALFYSIGKLYRTPVASALTILVVAIALALPGGLYVMLKNMTTVIGGWDHAAQVSLFLKLNVSEKQIANLVDSLQANQDVAEVEVITPQQALAEFKSYSGFGNALNELEHNPLPTVIVVRPVVHQAQADKLEIFVNQLRGLEGVDIAQLDLQWLQRLSAVMDVARRLVVLFAVLLGLAVLLIVGNTIRLDIQDDRKEIEVIKLIGATDAFIRRPFLYGGFWYGFLGGLFALLIVQLSLRSIVSPVRRLTGLYQSDYQLLGLSANSALVMLSISVLLGVCGSWLAVGRHLGHGQPQ